MATIIGTSGSDTLPGTAQDDIIIALGGSDSIEGAGGDDVIIVGDGGSDTVDGGSGVDTLVLGESLNSYSVSYSPSGGGSFLLTAAGVTETVRAVEFIAFDDTVVRVVGAGSATTLQAAVNAASSGETLLVAPGDYSAEGVIDVADKIVEVRTVLSGVSPIDDPDAWAVDEALTTFDGFRTLGTGGVVLDGVRLLGETGSAGDPGAGVKVLGTGGISVSNSIVSAVQFDNNGIGIEVGYVSGDVSVDNVVFSGFTTSPGTADDISSFGIYLNTNDEVERDVSITNSVFDLRDDGVATLRSYGIAFDGYGLGSGTLEISGNTFNNMSWGILFWDFPRALTEAPDYSGVQGNIFTDTDEASGNIRNLTEYVIVTGANISDGVAYESFHVGTGDGTYGGADTLVGTAGANLIAGNGGNDDITGGAGNDKIYGGGGDDIVNVDVSTDGADAVDLGRGDDTIRVSGAAQVRLTFTSAAVGDGSAFDAGPGGGLAVRLQAEDESGNLDGSIGRYDDEGITFVAAPGTTFDVRDISGTQRGDAFTRVFLGTDEANAISFGGASDTYANAGGGNDTVATGGGDDFLVGGTGDDSLDGGAGDDSFIGGAGTDTVVVDGNIDDYAAAFGDSDLVLTSGTSTETLAQVEYVAFDDTVARIVGAGSLATTLQDAADAAADSDTLLVAPGDYSSEGFIDITDKTIGVRTQLSGTSPVDDAAAWADAAELTIIDSFRTFGSGGVDLSGVRLLGRTGIPDDPAAGVKVLGDGDVSVSNSIISAVQFGAIAAGIEVGYNNSDIDVDNVVFSGFTTDPSTVGTFSGYGVYVNINASVEHEVSITDSVFDLRDGGDAAMRTYGVAFDGYGFGSSTLQISGNTFNDLTWGMLFWDSTGTLTATPDYSAIVGNAFTDTNEAVGNIRNLTNHVIVTGSNTSNGVLYADFRVGSGNADTIVGTAGANLIAGNGGNDDITGGAGNDKIYGGGGDDTVNVDVSTDGADEVDLGEGDDSVVVSGAAQVRLTFTSAAVGNGSAVDAGPGGGLAVRLQAEDGSGNLDGSVGRYDDEGITFVAAPGTTFDVRDISGTQRGDAFTRASLGNDEDDVITFGDARNTYVNAGGGNDTVATGGGDDFLVGGTGNDSLDGGAGNDTFLGGAGSDQLSGEAGNDTYIVTDADDTLVEAGNGGIDTVLTSLGTYVLGANVENLTFNGAGDFTGTGNGLENVITGGAGNDVLAGASGRDTMEGGLGDDQYTIKGDDVVVDTGGLDTARSNGTLDLTKYSGIENGRLLGSKSSDVSGDGGANVLIGNLGDNVIRGGEGRDTLKGDAGADTFEYRAVNESSDAAPDQINDFTQGEDIIDVFKIDARQGAAPGNNGNNAFIFIGDDEFSSAPGVGGQLRYEINGDKTLVQADVTGDNVADFTIRLTGAIDLIDGDFLL